MLYATNRFPGDGVTTTYEISFVGGYLDRSHVKAYIEGADLSRTVVPITNSNFVGPFTIGSLPVVPDGSTLVIYRDTPKAPLVDFVNGSRLTEHNLDTASQQGLLVAAEGADSASPTGLAGVVEAVTNAAVEAGAAASSAEVSAAIAVISKDRALLAEVNSQASATAAALDSAATAADKVASAESAAEALASEHAAVAAANTAVAAAAPSSHVLLTYQTLADATAAQPLADGTLVEVSQDETRAGACTRYKVQAGALVFVVNLDQVRIDLADTTDSAKGAALVGIDGGTLASFLMSKSARVVDSIAELKSLNKTKFTRAFATGYYAQGDGGGGAYWLDSTDVTTADNAGTVIVASDGGRWKLVVTDSVTIVQFGAKGDGATSADAAILAAVTWCKANAGIKLVIPKGTFFVTDTATFDLPNYSTIEFLGVISSTRTAYGPVVRIGSTTTNTFGLRVTGLDVRRTANVTTGGVQGVELRDLAFSKVEIKRVTGHMFGIVCNGTQPNGGVSYNDFYLSHLHDNTLTVYLDASGAGYCNENTFHGGSFNHSSGYPAVNTVHVTVSHFAANELNNNRFMFPSFEDNLSGVLQRAAEISGYSNLIFHPRMENPTDQSGYGIYLTAFSKNCTIEAPSFVVNVENILDSGKNNRIKTITGERISCPVGASGVVHSSQSTGTSLAKVYQGLDSGGVERFSVKGDGLITGANLTLTNVATQTSAPAAGAGGAIPAQPTGYLIFAINGVSAKIPYFAN